MEFYKRFTTRSEEKPVTGLMIIEKPRSFYDEMKISDERTLSKGSNKNYVEELRSVYILSDNLECLVVSVPD
jgi:hypothetical protein